MKRSFLLFTLIILITGQIFAQVTVTGRVTNISGEPVPGANVSIKGTTHGTVTNLEGYYSLSDVSPEATLVISFLGMLTEEMVVGDRTTIDVVLVDDIQDLDEVVVIGYGSVRRANLTGAVVDISAREIDDIPAVNLSTILQGKLPGIKIGQATGKPGAATSLQIRTTSSYGISQSPLYVIDGVVYEDQSRLDNLDPSEIESISILKDASAAVYGARAAGGVVLVKTRTGREGKARVNYSASHGIIQPTHIPEMLSAYEHALLVNEIQEYVDGKYRNDPDYERNRARNRDRFTEDELEHFKTTDYDWLDGLWQSANQTRHTLNVSGGTDKVRYFTGGSYYQETGHLDRLDVSRYSIRTNVEANLARNLSANLGLNIDRRITNEPYYGGEGQSGVFRDTYTRLLTAPRWVPPTIDGLPVANNLQAWHPYGMIESGSYRASRNNNAVISGGLEYKIPFINGLKVNANYSFSESNGRGKRYGQNYYAYEFRTTGGNGHIVTDELLPVGSRRTIDNREGLQEGASYSKSYQLNTSVSYSRTFGLHNVHALLVYEQSESESDGFNTTLTGAVIPGFDYMWAFNQTGISNSPSASETGRLGYIGRLNYGYANKYLFEGTFRYEASQKFHPDYAWGFYPAISLGWVISEESFFKDNISFINFMKFRGSAGRVGNDRVPPFQWKLGYSANQTGAIFGNSITNAIEARREGLSTPTLTWQKTNSYNAGLDTRLFDSRINFSFDYYYRFTYDILTNRQSSLASTAGIINRPNENYGEMYAKGIEVDLGYNGRIGTEFSYKVKGHFTWDKHRKLKVDQNPAVIGRWDDQLLNDPSNQPGMIATGIIRTQEDLDAILEANPDYTIFGAAPELGMMNYLDIRGENYSDGPDGKIDNNDRTIIAKYTSPPYNYGFSLETSWKGFRLSLVLTGEFGHKLFVNKDEMVLPDVNNNALYFWRDYWTPDNPDAEYPRPYQYGAVEQISTFWMRDGHSLRISNLNLSYSLPPRLLDRWDLPQARVYFSANNLWNIINPFEYKDPSVSRAYSYPMVRTYSFGVNLTL